MAELVYGSRLTEAPLKSLLNISWGLRVRIPLFKLACVKASVVGKSLGQEWLYGFESRPNHIIDYLCFEKMEIIYNYYEFVKIYK